MSVSSAKHLDVEVVDGSLDPDRIAEATLQLRSELRDLGVDAIEHVPQQDVIQGGKGSALEWAQLAVTFSGALPVMVDLIRSWKARRPSTTVTVTIDGDRLELSGADPELERRAVETWLQRHSGDER